MSNIIDENFDFKTNLSAAVPQESDYPSEAMNIFLTQAESYTMYKIGEAISQYYFPILVPIGVLGNTLSFLVMVQRHNRHSSFSLYISALAVTDTIALMIGFSVYLNIRQEVNFPPSQDWYCKGGTYTNWTSNMCSALFILSLTFERVYSIIMPHKAASVNTVKRARIMIVVSIAFSVLYHIPHLFMTLTQGRQCIPYGDGIDTTLGQFYYWLSFVINFALPFALLLIMNSIIIHALRKRSELKLMKGTRSDSQNENESKLKKSEIQIFVTLLLVTFSFLILTTPAYAFFLYADFYDYMQTPKSFAGFNLFFHVAQKLQFTNYGINFFLYILSGKKFRTDLLKLFTVCRRNYQKPDISLGAASLTDVSTVSRDLSENK